MKSSTRVSVTVGVGSGRPAWLTKEKDSSSAWEASGSKPLRLTREWGPEPRLATMGRASMRAVRARMEGSMLGVGLTGRLPAP